MQKIRTKVLHIKPTWWKTWFIRRTLKKHVGEIYGSKRFYYIERNGSFSVTVYDDGCSLIQELKKIDPLAEFKLDG